MKKMLKTEVTREKTSLNINGTLPDILTDLANIIRAINKNLEENGIGHEFRLVFIKAVMDGVMFGEDECRESMERYLQEADEVIDIHRDVPEMLIDLLKKLADAIKGDSDEAK
jgi:hypothetical protein